MKITDVSSAPPISNKAQEQEEESQNEIPQRKRTLLQRFNIPIDHLDFSYVNKCNDTREIERILRILRSGEEGTFPDLEKCVVARLEKLNPNSRLLRVEEPVIRTKELGKDEREAIQNGLEAWLSEVSSMASLSSSKASDIFTDEVHKEDALENFPLPVRGTTADSDPKSKEFSRKKENAKGRIKSWEYDKWDKYDVNAELTKLDLTDMQREEWEKRERPKIIEEQKKIERLMKSTNADSDQIATGSPKTKSVQPTPSSSTKTSAKSVTSGVSSLENKKQTGHQQKNKKGSMPRMAVEKPSYIEEINGEDDEEGVPVNTSGIFTGCGPRKTTVLVEDLNLAI